MSSIDKSLVEIALKEHQVKELLKLEELFHSHYMTQELLNAMVGLYVKFVQNIHTNQHPLRLFFMEKIKFVLSRPQVIRILEKDSMQHNRNMRDTIRGVVGLSYQQQQIQMKKMAQEAKLEVQKNHKINMKKNEGDQKDVLRQKERNMKIQMQMKIMEQVQSNMKKMKKQLNQQGEQRKKKQAQISQIVKKQDNDLNERLARRKKKLRKKSVQIKEKDGSQIEPAPPMDKEELMEMKKIITATYQRFTRLTQNKTKGGISNDKPAEGRVKMNINEAHPEEQEEIFYDIESERNSKPNPEPIFAKNKQSLKKEKSKSKQKKDKKQRSKSKEKKKDSNKQQKQQKSGQKQQRSGQKQQKSGQRDASSSVDYKPFDRKTGRVTGHVKVYEQIEDEDEEVF